MSECSESPSDVLLGLVANGDTGALDELIAQHREYVYRVVSRRLSPRLKSRVDTSDVVQETLVVAYRRIKDYLVRRPTSFRNWLYRLALQQVADTYRIHNADKRDVGLESPLGNLSAANLVDSLFGERASDIVQRKELLEKIDTALEEFKETDREILSLLYGEGLKNYEVAEILNMTPNAISIRHGRIIRRLTDALKSYGS